MEIIPTGRCVVVVRTIAYRVNVGDVYARRVAYYRAVTPGIVSVSADSVATCVINRYNVTEKIALKVDDYILTVFHANVNSR